MPPQSKKATRRELRQLYDRARASHLYSRWWELSGINLVLVEDSNGDCRGPHDIFFGTYDGKELSYLERQFPYAAKHNFTIAWPTRSPKRLPRNWAVYHIAPDGAAGYAADAAITVDRKLTPNYSDGFIRALEEVVHDDRIRKRPITSAETRELIDKLNSVISAEAMRDD